MDMSHLSFLRRFRGKVSGGGAWVLRRFFLSGLALFALAVLTALAFPGSASAQSVNLSVNPSSITEEGGTQKVTVTAVATLGSPQFCFYVDVGAHSASQQTATDGTDYADVSRKLVHFYGGTTVTTTFDVTATDDSVSDDGETIRVHSWKAGDQSCKYNYNLSYGATNLTLNDSDPKANLSVSPTQINENAGATEVTVTAALNLQGTRTLGSALAYTVSAGKTGDSATKDTDYNAAGGLTLTLPSGTANAQVTGTFTLTPEWDLLDESDETITVKGVSTNDGDAGDATITLKNVVSPCSSHLTDDLKADCAVLKTFYDDAGGDNWKTSTNWKTTNPLGQWHGITVSGGRVTEIKLTENQLTGTISTGLSALSNLVELSLWNNSLSGTIPDLSSLDNLEILHLDGNNLSGDVPDLSQLDSLWDINLKDNSLGGTVSSIGIGSASSRAYRVWISNNRLSGTIPDLGSNYHLDQLNLEGNLLSGTLDALASSGETRLDVVNLNYNKITGTIPDLSGFHTLKSLYVAGNRLSGTLANLTTLGDRNEHSRFFALDLGGNNLSGTIPDLSFFDSGTRVSLQLSLHGNNLSGPLPDLSSFKNMYVIELNENNFTGSIGDLGGSSGDLSVFSKLWILDLSVNSLTGEIPARDKLPQTVEYLHLNDNRLSGSVPDLSGFTRLRALGLWGNPDLDLMGITLPGGINRSVIDWAALWTLYYKNGGPSWSGWVGTKPLGDWHGVTTDGNGEVTVLNLRNKNVRGSISSSIAALAKLETLNLSCNTSLRGELPLQLKDITTLTTVNICSTAITLPDDTDFTTWKDGITTFKDSSTCSSPACPAPVSQQSSPPPSQESSLPPPTEEGSGSGEGADETENVPEPEPAVPAGEGDIEAGGGCALISGTQKPLGAAFSLLLAASVLLAVSRAGRRSG